ncbi:MAG: transcriptional regulator, partial [Clostridia bacterium]
MVSFGKYLKDYLEFNNISQTEFATRMGITQKHINEILNGKTNITLEMAANIERLTGISSSFIINVENSKKMSDKILQTYGNLENIKKLLVNEYHINELKKNNWLEFKDETNVIQECIDILNFLKIKDFDVVEKLEKQVLFKKTGTDFKKVALWIAHCDEITKGQPIKEYNRYNFNFLIDDLKTEAIKDFINISNIQNLLNCYG